MEGLICIMQLFVEKEEICRIRVMMKRQVL